MRNTFQRSVTLLIHYRIPHIFRVRTWCVPYSCSISKEQYSLPEISFLVFPYGTIILYGVSFQRTSGQLIKLYPIITSRSISALIRFALLGFRSPLLTQSHLLSLPPLTKMLQFSGLLFLSEYYPKIMWCHIRKFLVQWLLVPSQNLSQLATSFISVWNQAIHQLIWRLQTL